MFYQDPKSAFRILGVFYVERARRDIFAHDRRHAALSYRITGSSVFEDAEGKKEARDGAVTYIPAGCDYHHLNREHERILILHLEQCGEEKKTLQVLPNAGVAEPLFCQLLSAWEAGGEGAYPRCMSILYSIFALLCERQPQESAPPPSVIAPGVTALRENFRNPDLSVKRLADLCFVSEVYFRRIFHAHFGCSPLQMLLELRFDHATRLLSSGYYTPKQVAALSGFSDVKYFRTAYKKRFGRTPSDVINHHK
ncbi:MAG: helix-turn-helix transcriptional regulator [Ruminococcaceae bacterium]|nr:helix-turn-helix transcriptional regulator [Oscillospiraceae bacterium]